MFRVLIVEDEMIIRKGLVHTVDWTGMDCVVVGEAEDGEEGLAMIRSLKPDFVLTDICMPKKSGLEMIKAAKQDCTFSTIILSSYSEFEYVKEALKLSATDYLLKPIDPELLRKAVLEGAERLDQLRTAKAVIDSREERRELPQLLATAEIRNYYVRQVVETVKQRYREKLSLSDLALELHISERYLSSKFREETAHSFLDFLNRYRVGKAIELIRQERYRIAEISEMVGFTQYKQFHSVFNKYMGTSPSGFMKQYHFREKRERKEGADL